MGGLVPNQPSLADLRGTARAFLAAVAKGGELPLEDVRALARIVLDSELVDAARAVLEAPSQFAIRRALELATVLLADSGASDGLAKAEERVWRSASTSSSVGALATVQKRVLRMLLRRGLLSEDRGEQLDETELPPLHAVYAASVRQQLATGLRAGQGVLRLRSVVEIPPSRPKRPRHARLGDFDLHAG